MSNSVGRVSGGYNTVQCHKPNRRVTRQAFKRPSHFTEGLPPCSAMAGYVMRA